MLVIISDSKNPYINIATEEYILKNKKEDILILYINSPSVIVGKFQNIVREINLRYINDNKIDVVRRLSGGGCVYHDYGNVNFSFHFPYSREDFGDFSKMTSPIIDFLKTKNIYAKLANRSDILIEDKKFSGNAKFIHQNRVMQHGTILVNSNIDALVNSIMTDETKITDRATKSRRSTVTNINRYIGDNYTSEIFMREFCSYILKIYPNAYIYDFTNEEKELINEIAENRYKSWEWNYGKSPNYILNKSILDKDISIDFRVDVQGGVIRNVHIDTNKKITSCINNFTKQLLGCRHTLYDVTELMKSINTSHYFNNISTSQIIDALI